MLVAHPVRKSILCLEKYFAHATLTTKASTEHYDIIIGGGGLVGTALAAKLAQTESLKDKRILLLDGGAPFKGFDRNAPYGNRVSALNNNSVELFQNLGVWDRMVAARVKSVKQMQVWDASSDACIEFHHDHFANDVAYIVENDLMMDGILSALNDKTSPNVTMRYKTKIDSINLSHETDTGRNTLGLQGGQTLSCDLLIGSDGANSLVRKKMNVDVYAVNYHRMAIVATLKIDDAGDNCVAWQRFIPTGPVALLPLTETLSSLVWSTTNEQAKELLTMKDDAFVDALNEAFCHEHPKNNLIMNAMSALSAITGRDSNNTRQYPPRVSGVINPSRAIFPLGFLHASSYVISGAALVGDAAHRIHPLAGQGVNLGFSDIQFLCEALAEGAYAGARLSDKQYLLKYEKNSLFKNVPILLGVHGLQTLYSSTASPIVLLRSLGLQVTNNVPFLKNFFMQRAMG